MKERINRKSSKVCVIVTETVARVDVRPCCRDSEPHDVTDTQKALRL